MINRIIIQGRLTAMPELVHTQGGKALCRFSLAVNNYDNTTYFFNCTAWEKLATNIIIPYTKKGDMIVVEGKLQQQKWTDKENKERKDVNIYVENVALLGRKEESTSYNNKPQQTAYDTQEQSYRRPAGSIPQEARQVAQSFGDEYFSDEDIPF